MKKQLFAIAMVITAVFILGSCSSPFHSMPVLPPGEGGDTTAATAPENVTATHGGKRSITLSWTQKPNTELYYIYRADSPLNAFVRCGETVNTSFTFPVTPGSTIYYRVSAVSYDGKESAQSAYARGTSLAQPWITDITGITESSAAVTWYMDNVADDTYQSNLLYTVYCYNGLTEVAQIALDGSVITENRAVFTGLGANTRYEYVVEAYLRSDQGASEKSEKMDAATARRFRPGPPEKLKATRGTSVDSVELTFELPDMVDIALGENRYDPKPLYFVISKRLYSETHSNEYVKVSSYFGTIADTATKNGGTTFAAYIPGAVVKWTDDKNIVRGVEYEYMVQSYVDETPRVISSDDSKAHAVGWALSKANLSFNDLESTLDANGALFESARLPLDFDFDPKGEEYNYVLIEKIEPIEDDDNYDPDGAIEKQHPFDTHEAIRAHVPEMNLTQKTTATHSGRGVYSYTVQILLDTKVLDTITTIGKVEVSENTQPVIVEKFSVEDGYKDKFVLRWHYWSNRKYEIFSSDNRNGPWDRIHIENASPTSDEDATSNENHEWIYSDSDQTKPGITKYFAIQPARVLSGTEKKGQMVYARTESQTLGVPQISLGGDGASYGFITAAWTQAQKADTYRVKYWYTDEGGTYDSATVAETVKASTLSIGADGKFKYQFSPFENHTTDIARAGKEIRIAVDALNDDLHQRVGNEEIATTSAETVRTWLVGPAAIGLSASKAASASEIHVSWNMIGNADGYYVFRRQFNMTNAAEAGTDAIVYYVSADATITGKSMAKDDTDAKIDTPTVKASATLAGTRYTLTDMSMPDSDYNGTGYNRHTDVYRNQQNDMAQGYPYRYYVVPVVNRGGAPEPLTAINFTYNKDGTNKNTGIAWYTIRENGVDIRYNGAAAVEQEGFAIGFGQNVTATKGTYASSGNVNNGIKITWSAPSRLATVAGFDPRYTLYRKAYNSSTWTTLQTDIAATEYTDNPPDGRGIAYEYVVGISGSQPQSFRRFVDICYTMRDEKNRPNMLGYMLEMVRMDSVSRDWRELDGNYAEEVRWYGAGIKNSADPGNNNWGIDGYEIYVLNQNIDENWRTIADVTNLINQTNQNTLVTNTMGGGGLLKVMRDYHHYFKVRCYVKNSDGVKIYCPDPSYSWSAPTSSRRDGGETDYVKWGARQIGGDEFIRIVTLHIAFGLDYINGTGWSTGYFGRESNANGTNTQGSVKASSNFGVSDWKIEFKNYRDDIWLKNDKWITFMTLNGNIRPFTSAANQYPQRYGYWDPITITGPSDTPGLYSGTFRTGDGGDLYWDSGYVRINYPTAGSGEQRVGWLGQNTPLPYSGKGDKRHDQGEWR